MRSDRCGEAVISVAPLGAKSPRLSPDNSLAERSLRPLVIAGKISGGSRSAPGTETRLALASLFGTWQARGLNPFQQCLSLLHSS